MNVPPPETPELREKLEAVTVADWPPVMSRPPPAPVPMSCTELPVTLKPAESALALVLNRRCHATGYCMRTAHPHDSGCAATRRADSIEGA